MPRVASWYSRVRSLLGWSRLALLLFLTGCAVGPSLGAGEWYGRNGLLTARDFPETASAGQQAVDVDFELPTPQRAEELRQSGVQLPGVSAGTADPRAHRDFVDRRVTAVGFGLTEGGYLLYCEGLPLPVLVPESQVDLGLTSAEPLSASIYPDRDAALAGMAAGASRSGRARYAWFRGAGGALIVPTLFSPATTPRIARTMLEVREHLSESVQRELRVLLLSLTGTRVLQGVFSRVVRVGLEPEPGLLEPNRGLLPQDASVSSKVPGFKPLERPIGPSPTQNEQLQADIRYLRTMGAKNIRVNQQQLSLQNGQRVGTNRPDLQFDYNNRRYHVEYDTPTSSRGPGHQSRITSNDPDAETILLIVP